MFAMPGFVRSRGSLCSFSHKVLLAGLLTFVSTKTTVTFMLPQSLASTSRIAVEKDAPDIAPLFGNQSQNQFDPFFMQTEYEKIQSHVVLYDVIEELNLQDKWKGRYNADQPLTKQECYLLLKREIDVRQSRNTSLIEIRVVDEDKKLAKEIADKIADVHAKHRRDNRMAQSNTGTKALQEELAKQAEKVKETA